MSGLKYLVIVLLVETVRSYPLPRRYVRSINLQVQPSYGYPLRYPYGTAYPLQPTLGFPNVVRPPLFGNSQLYPYFPPTGNSQIYPINQPTGNSQIYPINQPNYSPSTGNSQIYPINPSIGRSQIYPNYQPNYPVINSPFPQSGPFYPQFPNYPYPSYPVQPNFPNFPDPFAHIPTEIIDVDENGNFGTELSWEDPSPKVEISSTQHSSSSQPSRPVTTQTVESNPIQTTITRSFDSHSSEPKIDVTYSNSDSNSGSGTLIEATGEETDNENNNDEKQNVNEEEGAEEEDKKVKTGGFSLWR